MILALYEHAEGIETAERNCAVYDLARNTAHFAAATVDGPAVVWRLTAESQQGARLAAEVSLDPGERWLLRCDRVDFPPGGIAYRHTHPGPGIRRLLHGSVNIESGGQTRLYRAGDPWFESGPEPVLATAGTESETAFVRAMLLPRRWAGRRTIRYVDLADEEKPKFQRATVFFEEPIEL